MKKVFTRIIVAVILIGIAFGLGWFVSQQSHQDETAITSQALLKRVQDQNFLVTKTLYIDETVTLNFNSDKGIKSLFTADELRGAGVVRIDVGVDVSELSEDDFVIDHNHKQISVYLPPAKILDASIYKDVSIETQKGIFTSIEDFLTNKEGEEYNQASRELISAATQTVSTEQDIFTDARSETYQLIALIAASIAPGYQVVAAQ